LEVRPGAGPATLTDLTLSGVWASPKSINPRKFSGAGAGVKSGLVFEWIQFFFGVSII